MDNLARFIAIFLVLTSTVNIAFSQTKKKQRKQSPPLIALFQSSDTSDCLFTNPLKEQIKQNVGLPKT